MTMERIVTVLGARPQFIKSAPLSAALRDRVREVIVHTGQHFDADMSDIFFTELQLKTPDYHLGLGGGLHGAQTGAMLSAIEQVLLKEKPHAVIVYGDTNSTLAGALAAVKLHIPVAHVEAGLRSYNRRMPEEINRLMTDHIATWLFAPSEVSRRQLEQEGITSGVHVVGDIMYDAVLRNQPLAEKSAYPAALGLRAGEFYLCTIHRAANTDDVERLGTILHAVQNLDKRVVLPLHPRTANRINEFGLATGDNICVIPPLGYLDMLQLQATSACVLTDSGGVQKEAYYLRVPCVTLREETEWVETVSAGWNRLVGTDPDKLRAAVLQHAEARPPQVRLYGDGDAAEQIAKMLLT